MSGRYIDADALNQDYQEWYKLFDWDDGGAEKSTIARAIRILNDQPTADVRKNEHGEWIDTGSGQECSVCKEVQYGYDNFRNFCQKCGADCRGNGHE